ncbi:DUF3560 domain-containing protein [Actinacidiphila sp. ITFR-21]|uniref:DUF3560 domain-containing protein n=1 Tax=Actinacidiphila sp. ITFR-21 TaxID=3075199 RepID=UPI0028899C7C|nr:DUF3560 domain-containing protein [Streptomyces sp. ITFR-21]WNI20200.1 DUF3560 domain-containing protein [Streptomyces sp. ITFR-21]
MDALQRLSDEISDLVMDIRVLRAHTQLDLYETALNFMPRIAPATPYVLETEEERVMREKGEQLLADALAAESDARWLADRAADAAANAYTMTRAELGAEYAAHVERLVRTVRAYVLTHRPEHVVAAGEALERAESARRTADVQGAEHVGATMPKISAVVSVAPDAAPSDPGAANTWEGEGGAVPSVDTPRGPEAGPTAAQLGPVPGPGDAPANRAKPAGRGDCAAANACGGFGVLLWDVPGCAPRCAECAAKVMGCSPAALRALTLPGDVVEAEEEADAADIVIRHTHEDGTTVEGSSKGDGVWEALKPLGWAYRRDPGIFIRGSRYKGADRWKINRAADAVRALGLSCAVVIEETMSFAEREAARVDAAEARAERFTDRAGRAAAESDRLWDAHNSIGERFVMGQPILIGHHSEQRARRDQERMWSMARKSVGEQRRAGYWANRAAASEAYERYRTNPGRTLRRIEKLEAERRGVLRERDGVDDTGRKADVWRREPSEARREELTRRLAEYDEELTYWAETIKEAERRGFKVWGKPDFVRGDFARCRGTWYEVTRVNAKTVTVPHIHAAFDGGAVGAVDGSRVVTRAATEQTRHKGSTYTLPYNEVSGRMSAEQMRAALAGEPIPTDPRDVTSEPAPEAAEAEQPADAHDSAADLAQGPAAPGGGASAPADVATVAEPAEVWEGEGGAVPGVGTPHGPGTGPTAAELGPVPGPGGAGMVTAAGAPAADAAPEGKGDSLELSGARQEEQPRAAAPDVTTETDPAEVWEGEGAPCRASRRRPRLRVTSTRRLPSRWRCSSRRRTAFRRVRGCCGGCRVPMRCACARTRARCGRPLRCTGRRGSTPMRKVLTGSSPRIGGRKRRPHCSRNCSSGRCRGRRSRSGSPARVTPIAGATTRGRADGTLRRGRRSSPRTRASSAGSSRKPHGSARLHRP